MNERFVHDSGCGFVKFSSRQDAERAIAALHGSRTLPPLTHPIQVKYADGETQKTGWNAQYLLIYYFFLCFC
jgi:hypothetical protein